MKVQAAVGALCLAVGLSCWAAPADAATLRWRHGYKAAPAQSTAGGGNAQRGYSVGQGGQGQGGWNAGNTWYNHPNNGNYAPPPYATSRSAFYQVGPVPAIGGVRSLPGWGGAR